MEYELGGDRAVIIVCALVAILSSSTSVSKDNTGTEECLCRDNLFFRAPEAVTTAKWRDVLEREQFSYQIVAISGDEVVWRCRPFPDRSRGKGVWGHQHNELVLA